MTFDTPQPGLFDEPSAPDSSVLVREPAPPAYEAAVISASTLTDQLDVSVSCEERLAKLAQEAAVCRACGLAETRNKVVFGEGNPDSPLVFVGEGPGQQEDATK